MTHAPKTESNGRHRNRWGRGPATAITAGIAAGSLALATYAVSGAAPTPDTAKLQATISDINPSLAADALGLRSATAGESLQEAFAQTRELRAEQATDSFGLSVDLAGQVHAQPEGVGGLLGTQLTRLGEGLLEALPCGGAAQAEGVGGQRRVDVADRRLELGGVGGRCRAGDRVGRQGQRAGGDAGGDGRRGATAPPVAVAAVGLGLGGVRHQVLPLGMVRRFRKHGTGAVHRGVRRGHGGVTNS